MSSSSLTPDFIKQKAREICYALIRVCYFVKRHDLRQRLERLSFEFLENAASLCFDHDLLNQTFKNIAALDVLVRMGHSLYEIEPVNATILVRELDMFNTAIRQMADENTAIRQSEPGNNPAMRQLPDLETIFSSYPNMAVATVDAETQDNQEITQSLFNEEIKIKNENKQSADADNYSNISKAIRQGSIIERIRQSGNEQPGNPANYCRFKDLIAAFPDISERTIRYDLQKLCEQGVIERAGGGGPAAYYKIKS